MFILFMGQQHVIYVDRIRDLRLVIVEGSRLVSETLEMFIAGVQAIALVLTVRGGAEERDLIGWYFSFAFDRLL